MASAREGETWYSVRVLYRSAIGRKGASSARTLLEESVFVFRSMPSSAAAKARKVARQSQHSYKNVYGEKVKWKLHQVLEIVEVMDRQVTDGTEIYYRFHLNAKPDATARQLGYLTKKTIVNV